MSSPPTPSWRPAWPWAIAVAAGWAGVGRVGELIVEHTVEGAAHISPGLWWQAGLLGSFGVACAALGAATRDRAWKRMAQPKPHNGLILSPENRRVAREIVETLHRLWFSDDTGNMDRNHRVSLWVPTPDPVNAKKWTCLGRTFDGPCAKEWPYQGEKLDPHCGVIAATAYLGGNVSLRGLSPQELADPVKWQEYCKSAYMTEAEANGRTWRGCSMEVYMGRSSRFFMPFVIVAVERRDGNPIDPRMRSFGFPAHLQLAGELLRLSEVHP